MATIVTTIDGLNAAIRKILDKYDTDVQKANRECVQKIGSAGVKALRGASAGTFGGSGKYAGSWTKKVESGRLSSQVTLYSNTPGLPHLLEHGHAAVNQWGSHGFVAGRTHIKPVEEALCKQFKGDIEMAVSGL